MWVQVEKSSGISGRTGAYSLLAPVSSCLATELLQMLSRIFQFVGLTNRQKCLLPFCKEKFLIRSILFSFKCFYILLPLKSTWGMKTYRLREHCNFLSYQRVIMWLVIQCISCELCCVSVLALSGSEWERKGSPVAAHRGPALIIECKS